MEVITIDSSDDDDDDLASSGPGDDRHRNAASRGEVTRQHAQSIDDDSSVSSADSIWDKPGLPSRLSSATYTSDNSSAGSEKFDIDVGGGDTSNVANEVGGSDATTVHNPYKSDKPRDNYGFCNNMKSINPYIDRDSARNVGGLNDTDKQQTGEDNAQNPAPTVDTYIGTWKVMLLMDHREFGRHKDSNFLKKVEDKINNYFGGVVHCEQLYLPSADYMFVARLISNANGEVIDERVLDMIIERKNVNDLQLCLIKDSKKYKPLSFFEAQTYKLQNCGIKKKLFLMEGDEDDPKQFSMYSTTARGTTTVRGTTTPAEQLKRLKRVKTVRLQMEKGDWKGIDIVCTKNAADTVEFLIQQLKNFKKSFNPLRPPAKTMEDLKNHINDQMAAPTFREYLRQISLPGIGDAKAMKVIMDPQLDWDKSFISPSCQNKKTKSTLACRATFWGETEEEAAVRNLENARENAMRAKKSNGALVSMDEDKFGNSWCGICRNSIDIWNETGIATCNRVAKCGKVFHEFCLAAQGYDITTNEGCVICRGLSKFKVQSQEQAPATKTTETTPVEDSRSPGQIRLGSSTSTESRRDTSKRQSVASSSGNQVTSTTKTPKKKVPTKAKSDSSKGKNPTVTPSTTSKSNKSTTSRSKKYKSPPEQLYVKRPKFNRQPIPTTNRSTIDRNGCPSNPLHDVDKSVAAALLLHNGLLDESNNGAVGSAKKKKQAVNNGKSNDQSTPTISAVANDEVGMQPAAVKIDSCVVMLDSDDEDEDKSDDDVIVID